MNRRALALLDSLERQGIDAARINPQFVETLSGAGLRFDRVALRFIDDVQSALHGLVPDGKTLVFTITAPIRQASRTVAALEENVRGVHARRSARADLKETINGNHIRVRLLKGVLKGTSVVGFVHNPDVNSEILFDMTQSLLGSAATAGRDSKAG